MAYLKNIPIPNYDIMVAKPDIRGNFSEFKTALEYDHYTFADASQGKHKKVTFIARENAPKTGTTECVLFTRNDALTNDPIEEERLTFRRESNGEIYQISSQRDFQSPGSSFTQSWGILPSGLLVKFESGKVITAEEAANGTYAFVFQRGDRYVEFTSIYTVFVSVVAQDPNNDNQDPNVAVYVENWNITPTAETVNLRFWRRDLPDTTGTDRGLFKINVLAIGKGPVT